MTDNNASGALAFALKLLGLRNHSQEELQQKLLKKGYTPESIAEVSEKLKREGIVDDRKFSMEFISSRTKRKPSGKLKMRSELQRKGVCETVISELLGEYDTTELCMRAAEKKINSLHTGTEADRKKKLEVFLRNRGFGWQEIQHALRRFFPTGKNHEEFF